jgi:predicted cupin superfamily sugar epimerase
MPIDLRAAHLIESLGLTPHPEGGYFRELHRSALRVKPEDDRSQRAALSTIYFLLPEGMISRWHRVESDEIWHYYEGAPIELFTADPDFKEVERLVLGPSTEFMATPVHVVPAGVWQAARSTGAYSLAGCTVGPGFEFADFEMLRDNLGPARTAAERDPQASRLL